MKLIRIFFVLMMCIMAAACGSSGGKDDGGGTVTPVTPVVPTPPSYNLTGIIYGENGAPLPGVTVYVFSPSYTTVSDANGKYSSNVTKAEHLLLASRAGSLESFKLVNLSSGNSVSQPLMLYNSSVASVNVIAKNPSDPEQWTKLVSNGINNYSATVNIPPQPGGTFTVAGQKVSSVNISVEYLDNSKPFPVQLPSPETLNPIDVVMGGKQAPSVMVAIKPAMLSLESRAELILPNPHKLIAKRILRFDPEDHHWVETNSNTDKEFVPITKGGIYGIFFEDNRTSTVKGSAPAGSIVFAGDEIIKVPSDGNFTATVAMPPDGMASIINLVLSSDPLKPNDNKVTQTSADFTQKDKPGELAPNQVVSVTFVQPSTVVVKTVTVESGSDSLVADGVTSMAITATVQDATDQAIPDGVTVNFTTSVGSVSPAIGSTRGGIAQTTLTSALDVTGPVTVTASAGGVFGKKVITFIPRPKILSLSLSKPDGTPGFSVKSDNSDYLNVTANVLNSNNAPYNDLGVKFSIDSGQMVAVTLDATGKVVSYDDPAKIKTDQYGKATIRFSAGPDERSNRTVNITASTGGLTKTIPVLIAGTTITISNDKTNLDIEGNNKSTLIVVLKDAGGNAIFNADVTANVVQGSAEYPGQVLLKPIIDGQVSSTDKGVLVLSGKTDIKGEVQIEVNGKGGVTGQAMVEIKALGNMKSQVYSVNSTAETFAIISPDKNPTSLATNTPLPIVVKAAKQKNVRFTTTFGLWEENGQYTTNVVTVAVKADGTATANLKSQTAGLATIQVLDFDNPSLSDTIQIAIAAPSSEADKISLQASSTMVAPSIGNVSNSVVLRVTVRNSSDQVVKDAPIAFSMGNTLGGGEYISPAIVYTDAQGVAEAKFYSGSISSKSEKEGVTINATALTGSKKTSTVSVVIGGTATSIIIGASTKELANISDTAYKLPMSVQVVDSKGNPVPNTKVTLGIWPVRYETGYFSTTQPCKMITLGQGPFPNEDINRNVTMDTFPADEDANHDGKLTPPSSAAGELPPIVETGVAPTGTEPDSKGTANFTLTYLKASAGWIEAEVTATAVVLGTETKSVYTFWLPYLTTDACFLPPSPYNPSTLPSSVLSISANPTTLLSNGKATSEVSARLIDFTGAPVIGSVVTFTVSGGGGLPNATTTTVSTDTNGVAKVTYQAPSKVSGTATISATTAKVAGSKSVSIALGTGSLQMLADPAQISADGIAKSSISVTIVDQLGGLFTTAESVLFTITSGGGSLSATTVTSSGGSAGVFYTSGKTPGTATIKAELINTGASATADVNLLDQGVGFITLTAAPTSIKADGITSSQITATITNRSGGPVPAGTPVTFTTSAGKFQNGSDTYSLTTADSSGTVVVSLISGYSAATAVVTCAAAGSSQSTTVMFTGSGSEPNAKPAYIQPAPIRDANGNAMCLNSTGQSGICDATSYTIAYNYPSPKNINVRGTPGNVASKVVFTVYDTKGKPMTNITNKVRVDFQIVTGPNGGEILLTPFDYTNGSGEVSTIIRSGSKSGTVIVRAICFQDKSVSASTGQIAIGGGYPTGEGFSLSAQYLNISGMVIAGLEDPITARLTDDYGNNVADGTTVSFKTYNTGGYINPPSASTTSGVASVKLISAGPDPENGIVSVTAESVNGALSTRITSFAVSRETEYNRILYAGTNGGGVYKSTDSGQSWVSISRSNTVAGQNRIDPYINDIMVDPINPNIIYAATGYQGHGNVFRSQDGGQTWTDNDQKLWQGFFPTTAAVLAIDADETIGGTSASRIWVGTAGNGIYTLDAQGKVVYSEKTRFTYVNAIVKVRGQNIVYVGTVGGVYKSVDGGKTWTSSNIPSNQHIVSLAIHPRSNGSIIYAGTKDSGLWLSVDGGASWTQHNEGFGKGVFATYPKTKLLNTGTDSNSSNLGNGAMSEVKVLSKAKSESWTVTYSGSSFKITGSLSGELSQRCTVDTKCTIPNIFEFTISSGTESFKEGDTFTFDTLNDDGRNIRNLMVDSKNNRLYALTYFKSDVASHATGSVYVHDLTSNGEMSYTDWKEASITGLKTYASTGASMDLTDTSLLANHALASDDPSNENPTMLYLGGEGINFYRANLGSSGQVTAWQEQNTGLSNLIMARMPIVFSGNVFIVECQSGTSLMDINGNPPVSGATFDYMSPTATQKSTYNIADRLLPYLYSFVVGTELTFSSTCTYNNNVVVAPGCSGLASCTSGSCVTNTQLCPPYYLQPYLQQ